MTATRMSATSTIGQHRGRQLDRRVPVRAAALTAIITAVALTSFAAHPAAAEQPSIGVTDVDVSDQPAQKAMQIRFDADWAQGRLEKGPDDRVTVVISAGGQRLTQSVENGDEDEVSGAYRITLRGQDRRVARKADALQISLTQSYDTGDPDPTFDGALLSLTEVERTADRWRVNTPHAWINNRKICYRLGPNLDLSQCFLDYWNLVRTDMSNSDLTGASMNDVQADGVLLTQANLTGAQIRHARMRGAQMDGSVLDDADLSHTDLTLAILDGASVVGTNLSGTNLTYAVWVSGDRACGLGSIGDCL